MILQASIYFISDIATDAISENEFNTYLTKFLFTPSGSKYQKMFRFDGDLKCGQPAPPITVSIQNIFIILLLIFF